MGTQINDGSTDTENPWNINIAYLRVIERLRDLYVECRINHDFDGMFEALEQLEIEASIEVPEKKQPILEAINKEIKWLYENKDKWCNRDRGGKITHTSSKNKRYIIERFNETYRALLKLMADINLLTRVRIARDPGRAILEQ